MTQTSVRSYLAAHAAELERLLAGTTSAGVQLARRSAEIMDALLCELFHAARGELRPTSPVVFAAVGGYGRKLLGWKSDLDVRLITSGPPEQIEPLAEAIFYPLWDAGVSVGHQVVTIDSLTEDARSDLPTATALLDLRALAGELALAEELNERVHAQLFTEHPLAEFLERLHAGMQERRARLNDPQYLLEPDVKNGEGGLRDLDCALWAAGARWRVADLTALCGQGLLAAQELAAAQAATELIWSVRNRLHRDAGRKCDRLTFEEQERIALELGYAARVGATRASLDPAAIEAMAATFMSDYNRHARSLAVLSERLLARARAESRPRIAHGPVIPPGVCRYGDALGLAPDAALEHEPELALQLVAAAVDHQLPVHGAAREAIQRACTVAAWKAALRASPRAAAVMVSLVSETRAARFRGESILAELQELGLLTALIPEFEPVVARAHHDTYHVYTVDVHSIYAVDYLRALLRADTGAGTLVASVAKHVRTPELLWAVLLHDIGKARPGRGHAQRGAEMARTILRRLRLAPRIIDDVCLLIREHLTMYKVALHRDLADPYAIASFARVVRDQRQLAQLYLLTLADVSTTSPVSMTEWKHYMLDELYVAAQAYLDGCGAAPLAARAAGWAAEGEALRQFVETMPARYQRSSSPTEASLHARAAQEASAGSVLVTCVPGACEAITELCVVTPPRAARTGLTVVAADRPGLLSMIAAALAANRVEVCAAAIHTRRLRDGSAQAVDRFWIRTPSPDPTRLAARIANVEQDLRRLLAAKLSARELMDARKPSRWSERPAPNVPTRVFIDHDASPEFSVIEVRTKDRPGLLFTLTETLRELRLEIALAKISTEGARATDAFYITDDHGRKLAPGPRTDDIERRLLAALDCEQPTLPQWSA